jgi:ectoine hydroxylase-related dioxygenase (phytanoyl-CoA dioxygenase family)
VLTAWVSLDEATEENGALRYIDGGHHSGLVPHAVTNIAEPYNVNASEDALDLAREVSAPVGQGGVVFHHGAALHSSTANTTPTHRRAYAIHYCASGAAFYDDSPTAANGLPLGGLLAAEGEELTEPMVLRPVPPGGPHHQASGGGGGGGGGGAAKL